MERQRATSLAVLAALLLLFLAGAQAQADCKGNIGDNKYDLSGLASAVGTVGTSDSSGQTYTYRPCGSLYATCGSASNPNPAVCQRDRNGSPHDLGNQALASWTQRPDAAADRGFVLTFAGGEGGRKTAISFQCDTNGGNGQWSFARESPQLTYNFDWTTKYACPTGNGGGGGGGGGGGDDDGLAGGWIFIIVLVCVSFTYLVLGVVYNKFVAKKEGTWELIPNVEFWMALPGLVKDGNLYAYRKVRGLLGGGSYEQV